MELVCHGMPLRQGQAIALAAQGYPQKVIARIMGCSVDNVRNLLSSVYFKWHAPNVASAVAEGFKRGHLKYLPVLIICLTSVFGMNQDMRPVRRPARSVAAGRMISSRATV